MPSIKPIRDITNTAATPSGDEWILIDNGIDMAKAKIDDAVTPKATEIVEDKIADLNLGTAATANVEDFATAAQGSKADTAVQPSDLATVATTGDYADLTNKPTLGTVASHDVEEFATAEQGGKADSAVQPEDLAAVATTGSYNDLLDKPTLGTAAAADASDFATAAQGAKADTAVQSVNSKTGTSITLTASDVGAAPDTIATALAGGTNGQVLIKASNADHDFTWVNVPGGGDMLSPIYDPNGVAADAFDMDNMVEGSTNLILTAAERADIAANTSARHSHDNKAILDATEQAFTTALKNKLDGILDFDTVNDVQNSIIPTSARRLRTAGFYAAGDGGGALYRRVETEPTHPGKIQSADGAWWELADAYETDAMFGGEGRLAYSARGALGNYNTKLGLSVGANLTGGFNLLAGYNTGSNMTSGARNVLLGHNLGSGDTIYPEDNKPFTGTDNNGIGFHALKKNQDGSNNNALGRDALNENYSGNHNVAVGTGAGQQIVDSNDNVFIGSLAGARAFDTAGLNVYVGRDAGRENKSGERSTLIGWGAGRGITPPPSQYTGDGTTKTFNVPGFVFTEVKQVRVDVNGVNVLPAHYSVNGVDGEVTLDFAPAPGDSVVLTPTIGTSNHSRTVAVGQRSLYSIKTGDGNVAVGSEAGMSLEQGTGNVIIGTYAAESMTEGSGNIIIGPNAYKAVTSADNMLVIANQSGTPFIEGQMNGATEVSNMLTVDAALRPAVDDTRPCGTASRRWNAIFCTNGTINTSDEREKDNIVGADTDEAAIRAVRKIKIRRFQWKEAISRKGPEGARLHFGVIAQEVKEAFESEGLDPFQYGVLCYDEWPEERGMVPSGRVDENGDPIMVEAVTVEGGNRYGVRMDQLLALKIAAMEAE